MRCEILECEHCRQRRADRARRRREQLRAMMRDVVAGPINCDTEIARKQLVRREAPRWRPDRAFVKHVGDPVAFAMQERNG
jgi:L-serine deaminase